MGKQLQWAHTYKSSTDVIYIWYILLLLHLQIKYVIYNAGFKSARRVFWHGELSQKNYLWFTNIYCMLSVLSIALNECDFY